MTGAAASASGTAAGSGPGPAAAPPTAVLEVRDLSVRYRPRGRVVHAVDSLSYTVPAGRTVAIIGESGSGKTASSRAIMGLLPRSAQVSGSAVLNGTELIGLGPRELRRHRGHDVAMIFQDPARSLNPTMRVGPQIAEAIRAHQPVGRAAARERVIELFRLVRLSAPEQRYSEYPHQFSGGMRQRAMIAMALSCSPRLLIADEATTALDVTTQAQIMRLLAGLQAQLGMAILMISHDLGLAASFADDVVVMYAGRAVERAPARKLFGNVRMPYTSALLGAVPRLDRAAHTPLPVVGGRPPDLSTPSAGCPFAARCPRAAQRCERERPELAEDEPGHAYACWYPLAGSARPASASASVSASASASASRLASASDSAAGEAR
jgi:oligopeptide/dipeptide ABC transporter ATP-binding protein